MPQALYLRARASEGRTLEFLVGVLADLGHAGLVLFLASAITGVGFLGPESGRITTIGAEKGADDPEVQRRASRILWISRIELILLIAVIFRNGREARPVAPGNIPEPMISCR